MEYYDPFRCLFCITIDNSNEMGIFYNSLNQTNSQFLSISQQDANKQLVFYYRYIVNAASIPYIESTVYNINDPLRINSNTALRTNIDSLFLIYIKGAYGECNLSGSVKFMVNIPQFKCGLNIVI